MGFHLSAMFRAKQIVHQSAAASAIAVPKGYLAVYVGENQMKRFVIPISFLNKPSFRNLLRKAEQEFGYEHPMGGLTIPCREDIFMDVISC